MIAMAIYTGARPFSLSQDYYLIKAFKILDSTFTLPDRFAISTNLLDKCYDKVKENVDKKLAGLRHLNFSFDESTNIRNQRILSVSLSVPSFSLFILSADIEDTHMDSRGVSSFVLNKLEAYFQSPSIWSRVNSLTTDTCNVMKAAWDTMRQDPRLKHCFFVPCDSHGLQLLIKDVLHLPKIHSTFSAASNIVGYFRSSPKQQAILGAIQSYLYKKQYSLIASVITRWGSQYLMLTSVERISRAIQEWARETTVNAQTKEIVRDLDFWDHLRDLINIIRPIHEAQLMSEAQNANIIQVSMPITA